MITFDFERLFARVPLLADKKPGDFTITLLPSYTNLNYRLFNRLQDWVLRVPRAATDRYIDRAAEAHNQACACDLGLAPRPLWSDASGLSLTPTLVESRCLTPDDLVDSATLQAVGDSIGKLHRSAIRFRGVVQLDQLLNRYYSLLTDSQQLEYRPRMESARQYLPLLQQRDAAYVASHNDLVLANLLLQHDRLWLIDWEFSAMASPYWDLATVCNAAGFDERQCRQLMNVYCAGGEVMEESLLFDYRNLLQLLSDCWMAALVN